MEQFVCFGLTFKVRVTNLPGNNGLHIGHSTSPSGTTVLTTASRFSHAKLLLGPTIRTGMQALHQPLNALVQNSCCHLSVLYLLLTPGQDWAWAGFSCLGITSYTSFPQTGSRRLSAAPFRSAMAAVSSATRLSTKQLQVSCL